MKYFIFLFLIILSSINSCEWLRCEDHALPRDRVVLFYDAKFEDIYMMNPAIYLRAFVNIFDIEPRITHWMEVPPKPKKSYVFVTEDHLE